MESFTVGGFENVSPRSEFAMAQSLNSIYATQYVSFANNTDSVLQTFANGGTTEAQTFQ